MSFRAELSLYKTVAVHDLLDKACVSAYLKSWLSWPFRAWIYSISYLPKFDLALEVCHFNHWVGRCLSLEAYLFIEHLTIMKLRCALFSDQNFALCSSMTSAHKTTYYDIFLHIITILLHFKTSRKYYTKTNTLITYKFT